MLEQSSTLAVADRFRRAMLLTVVALAVVGTLLAWYLVALRHPNAPALDFLQGVSAVALTLLFVATWLRWLPVHAAELCALIYAAVVCMACMLLRMYWSRHAAAINLEALYLWFPVLYIFAFMVAGTRRAALAISLSILALFVIASLPFLLADPAGPDANITVQAHIVSAAVIVALYFYSGYRHRLRAAEAKVDELAHLSTTDELTGLANRRGMATLIERELLRPIKGGARLAVLLFDVDRFKQVNDSFGHGAGDATLVALAGAVRRILADTGMVGRWGGDEFVVLLRVPTADAAVTIARQLCGGVGAAPMPHPQAVTISCGVTLAQVGDSINNLMQRVDAALYAAKRGGRDRVESVMHQR